MISTRRRLLFSSVLPALFVAGAAFAQPGAPGAPGGDTGEAARSAGMGRTLSAEARPAALPQVDLDEVSRSLDLDTEVRIRAFGTVSRSRSGEETREEPGEELMRSLEADGDRTMNGEGVDPAFEQAGTDRAIFGQDERVRVNDTTAYPFSAVGILEAKAPNGEYIHCSAALIGPRTVLTTASCLYSNETGWNDELLFAPAANGYDDLPFGVYDWETAHIMDGYISQYDGSYSSIMIYDLAVVVLQEPAGDQLGWLGFQAEEEGRAFHANLLGYPQDKQPAGTMWRSNCDVARSQIQDYVIDHTCSTAQGSGGSPLYVYNQQDDSRMVRAVDVAATDQTNIAMRLTQFDFDWIAQHWK